MSTSPLLPTPDDTLTLEAEQVAFRDFDYTLKIAFDSCSVRDLQYILQVLYNGSSGCIMDIVEMADETIYRMDIIGYDISNIEYKLFIQFINSLLNVLKRLNLEEKIATIHEMWQTYAFSNPLSPAISSPGTPIKTSPPKIMKKAKSKFSRKKETRD